MNKKFIFSVITSFSLMGLGAQTQDPVLMKINNKAVKKSEFEYLYHKNNTAAQQPLSEYVNLFIDYKLKVEEALTQGQDTARDFVREYTSYKNQITQPYLVDSVSEQIIAKREYDRQGENIESSHILIRFPEGNLLPKDTLEVYQKTLAIRENLFGKKPKTFEELAFEYSEDPSAKRSERAGYLGWGTSLMFVSPFEDALFNTPKGEISMPVRTMFGYHLIKVHDKKADQGKVSVAHIMFGFGNRQPSQAEKDSVLKVAKEVYTQLQNGADYSELCEKYSADKMSTKNGGSLGWVNASMGLPPSFLETSYALNGNGSISQPVETPFGYHIIKLEDKAPRDSWEASKAQIVSQIKSSDLLPKINKLQQQKFAKDLTFVPNTESYNYLLTLANDYFPLDSVYRSTIATNNSVLFTIDGKGYTLSDFNEYIPTASARNTVSTEFVDNAVGDFALAKLKEAYTASLSDRFPDYGNLQREYHDGILLFNVMNQEVWEKAANDTIGLTNYFKKNKSKYTWDAPHYKGYIVYCKDEETLKAAQKLANSYKKDDLNVYLKEKLNNDSVNFVLARRGIWGKGDNKFVDAYIFKVEEQPEPVKDYPYYFVAGKMMKNPEEYLDVKGMVTSDLQEQMEKEWVANLRGKYVVEIDEEVLKTVK